MYQFQLEQELQAKNNWLFKSRKPTHKM
jgi:hypothetical protein